MKKIIIKTDRGEVVKHIDDRTQEFRVELNDDDVKNIVGDNYSDIFYCGEFKCTDDNGNEIKLYLDDLKEYINSNYVDLNSDWAKVLKKFENKSGSSLDRYYIKVYDKAAGVNFICAYILLDINYKMTPEYSGIAIEMYFLSKPTWQLDTLQSISLAIKDWDDNFFLGATYINEPRILNIYLHNTAEYDSLSQLLSAIKITQKQWNELLNGKYTFVKNTRVSEFLPIMQIENFGHVKLGNSSYDSAHYYDIFVSELNSTYSVVLTDV